MRHYWYSMSSQDILAFVRRRSVCLTTKMACWYYIIVNYDLSFASCMVGEALTRWAEASPELPCSFAMWVVDNVEELHKSLPRTRFFSLLAASRAMQSNAAGKIGSKNRYKQNINRTYRSNLFKEFPVARH